MQIRRGNIDWSLRDFDEEEGEALWDFIVFCLTRIIIIVIIIQKRELIKVVIIGASNLINY